MHPHHTGGPVPPSTPAAYTCSHCDFSCQTWSEFIALPCAWALLAVSSAIILIIVYAVREQLLTVRETSVSLFSRGLRATLRDATEVSRTEPVKVTYLSLENAEASTSTVDTVQKVYVTSSAKLY